MTLTVAWAQPPQTPPVQLEELQVQRLDDGYYVNADMLLEWPSAVEEALIKGVPLHFVARVDILRERWYWTDKEVASASRYQRLAFHPLTRRWRLQVSNTPIGNAGAVLGQTFDTREEAMAAVERIFRWKIAEAAEIDADARHSVTLRFRVDQTQLPRPFQIGVIGQGDAGLSASRTLRLGGEPAK